MVEKESLGAAAMDVANGLYVEQAGGEMPVSCVGGPSVKKCTETAQALLAVSVLSQN